MHPDVSLGFLKYRERGRFFLPGYPTGYHWFPQGLGYSPHENKGQGSIPSKGETIGPQIQSKERNYRHADLAQKVGEGTWRRGSKAHLHATYSTKPLPNLNPTLPNHNQMLPNANTMKSSPCIPQDLPCLIYMVSGGTCRQTSGSNICTFHSLTVTFVQTFKPAMIPDTYRLTQTLQARASTVTLQ